MTKKSSIEEVSQRSSRTENTGTFQDFQAFGKSFRGKTPSKPYSQYEQDPYNKYQNILYKRAMFGIKIFTPEELEAMHPEKIERIKKVNKKAQREINLFKQERLISITNKMLSLFKKDTLAGEIIDLYSEPDTKFVSKTSLKDLNIAKEDVIERLTAKGILPRDFYSIKQ